MVFYFHNRFYPSVEFQQQKEIQPSKPTTTKRSRSYKKRNKPDSQISSLTPSTAKQLTQENREFLESLGLQVLI